MIVTIPAMGLHTRHGGVRVLCEIASGLVERGHQVTFLTFDGEEPTAFPTRARTCTIGPAPTGRHLWRDLLRQHRLRQGIERHVRSGVLLANHHLTAGPVARARVPAERFYYIQAYEPRFYPGTFRHAIHRRIARRSYDLPLRHIANCGTVAAEVHGRPAEHVPIVPPGLDPTMFHAAARAARGSRLVVGTLSRSEHWKGTCDCFAAVHEVRRMGIEVDFHVAFGHIPPRWRDEPRVDAHPHDDRELADWYRSIDVLVAAVHGGGAPYPPLEAMACGAAVVTTPNDHVTDGVDALTAPDRSPHALGAALGMMLTDHERRSLLIHNGLARAKRHAWSAVVGQMEAILLGHVPAPVGRR